MKKISFLSGLLALAFSVNAQSVPEFKNKVMFVEANNTLSELEKTDLATSLKTGMTGRSEVNIIAKGKSANVAHAGSTSESYMVKIEPGTDPETVVELFKFEESKKDRKFLAAAMVMGKDKAVDLPKAKLAFKKVSDGVYTITPAEKLEEGEYCFMVNRPNISILGSASSQSLQGYCFHVGQ